MNQNIVGTSNISNREAWLKNTLKKIPKGKKILDAGAGELQYKKYCTHLKYKSQDFGKYTGDNVSEGLQMGKWDNSKLDIVSDITNIPVKKNSFDAIMCIEVLEHLPKPIDAIKEFSRILKKGGKLIITTPFASITHFAPYFYSNGFSKYWYEQILKEFNFKIIDMDINGNYYEYLAQELHRLPNMTKEYAHRKMKRGEKKAIAKLLKMFSEMSQKDKKSHELSCYGIHVLAQKVK